MFSKNLHAATSQMRGHRGRQKGRPQKVCCVNSWNGICTLLRKRREIARIFPKVTRTPGNRNVSINPGSGKHVDKSETKWHDLRARLGTSSVRRTINSLFGFC
ncbi:hypothetical protein CEXT_542461 [Caerostris extrusa]|uniref:Uncharacterized protein n=1 Tax=Caerostris extrusa TaxID=172846 RepID=A0AAV4NKV6_CAEEX|nr:hypothetical protein CEXT_542461 [Caerostris extrusa]